MWSTLRAGLVSLVTLLAMGSVGFADTPTSMEPLFFAPLASTTPDTPPPLRLAARFGRAPVAALDAAEVVAPQELQAIADWNRAGRVPARNGFSRALVAPERVDLGPGPASSALPPPAAVHHAGGVVGRSASGSLVWGGEVRVEGAHRLRLHLSDVELPAGSRIWVYSGDEVVGPVGLELLDLDGLWTPSTGGPSIHLEVEVPTGSVGEGTGFVIDRVLEIFPLDPSGQPRVGSVPLPLDISCLIDAQCIGPGTFDVINGVQQAIAHYQFVVGSSAFICSGGLLNDTTSSGTPFFLTANHCLSTQSVANTLEAFWNYYTNSCNGTIPNLGTLPRSLGGDLLATGASSDFTLLELNSIPGNRAFLGWNANPGAAANGTTLHRVSHPLGSPQTYNRTLVDTSAPVCLGAPRPQFLYQELDLGGTFGGSSGAPLILSGGQTVGQLTGGCGPNGEEGCDPANSEVDGAFSQSFSALAPFLTGTPTPPCTPDATTLCLNNDRFQVRVDWRTAQGATGQGQVVPFGSDDSGLFFFFGANNWEMLLKVLNGCGINNRYWVFAAATTDVEYTLTVTDTQADKTKEYFNPQKTASPAITDTAAFATCP